MKCRWCSKQGHEDCSPRATQADIVKAITGNDAMLTALVQIAAELDQAVAMEMGGSACWKPEERGYGLLLRQIEHVAGLHNACDC